MSEPWTGSKRQREALRQKFGGKCAYCGACLSGGMHADHLEPVIRIATDQRGAPLPLEERRLVRPERNVVENMMPACKPCNLHKGGYPLEMWRDIIQRSAAVVRNQTSTFRAGERFGVISVSDAPVRFYFERIPSAEQHALTPHALTLLRDVLADHNLGELATSDIPLRLCAAILRAKEGEG